jgi:Bacterial Ig domain
MKRLLPFLIIVALAGCGKSDDIAPVITMIAPTDNGPVPAGQNFNVRATITDNEGIHMVHMSVTDNSTNGHVVHLEEHLDAKSYDLNQSFLPIAGRSYTIDLDVTDHGDNDTKKEIIVSAN